MEYRNRMNDDISSTIEVLANRVRAKEEEANKLKKLVNELCVELGIDQRYAITPESGGISTSIRSDQFYGVTLPAAIRNYLEFRKAGGLGAAPVDEIYRAVKGGGYKFETASEENAKTGVRNALRTSSSIFHRLPNGHYGLLSWYPSAKAPDENGAIRSSRTSKGRLQNNQVTNEEVRDLILGQPAQFTTGDIISAVKSKLPSKELP